MSLIYYTADLHFGHDMVAKLRGYEDYEQHDASLILEWKHIVKERDIVYILGDITLSKYDYALEILRLLPGRKHLISGNHDIVHPMHSRGHRLNVHARWLEIFETIQPFIRKKISGKELLLSHFPYTEFGDGEGRGKERYNQYRLPNYGLPLLHGHTHGVEREHDNMLHVGWDAWGTLLPQQYVADWLNEIH